MAGKEFEYGGYHITWLAGEACATRGSGKGRKRYRLGVYTEEAARAAIISLVDAERKLNAKREGSIGALFKIYRDDREKDGKQVWAFDVDWKRLEPTFGNMRPEEVTREVCRDYARTRFETGSPRKGRSRLSNDTVWNELARLSACLNWAERANLITAVPPMWFPQRAKRRDVECTPEDIHALLAACEYDLDTSQGIQHHRQLHLRTFIILALCTGGRHAALLELEWDRVDFDRRLLKLAKPSEDDPMSHAYEKGRATVYINDLLLDELLKAKSRASGRFVVEFRGQKVGRVNKAFAAAVERAGLNPDLTPHILRHAVASWCDEHNIDARDIATVLGHKNEKVTKQVYIHRKPEKTAQAVGIIDKAMGAKRFKIVGGNDN